MNVTNIQKREYIGYEYKEIITDKKEANFLMDSYENFGWEILAGENRGEIGGYSRHQQKVSFRMRRNRKILNKMELTRLQRHFEACVNEIQALEHAKTSLASMYALTIGIVGTAFMAGAVFAVTATPPHIMLCIILAVPAFIGWILPYFVYKRVARKQTEKMNALIEIKYDEIDEICAKGSKLLSNNIIK